MISSLIFITSVICLVIYYASHRSLRRQQAVLRLSASKLVDAFSRDEAEANSLYSGKVVEVEGTLKEMILNDSTLILLIGDSALLMGLSCYLNKDQKQKYTTLKRGERVRVQGVCNGRLLGIVLNKCILLPHQRREQKEPLKRLHDEAIYA